MPDPIDFLPKKAHPATVAANTAFADSLPFDDVHDFENAKRGFIGCIPDGIVQDNAGRTYWDMTQYAFLNDEHAPDTVNPSLWRQARLNMHHGLFKVTDRVYQIRGMDLANITIIEGDTGLILLDTLTTSQVATAALDLYFQHRPRKPVHTVIYSHSHTDHYGGVLGVISPEDVEAGKVSVIAPNGFMEAVGDENILPGNAMSRRGQFQFGQLLEKGPFGQVDSGLGKVTARGTLGLIAPTQLIVEDTETHVVDGVELQFQMAPDSEAPAEMHLYLPQFKVLNLAENAVHNLHNFIPLRGTVVRDPRLWSGYIDTAITLYGQEAEILIGQHHWPIWGNSEILRFLEGHRDLFKHVHDQTLRLMNHGLKPAEISEVLTYPPELHRQWGLRGYYGTLSHNSKAVYQRYLSWYDANPVNLNPLPPREQAERTLHYMGGARAVLEKAEQDLEKGDFRWVAQVASQVVLADPANMKARALAADALEQMGYQAESATWRNAYLNAAMEFRHGLADASQRPRLGPEMMKAIGADTLLAYLGVRLNPEKAGSGAFRSIWEITDQDLCFALTLSNQTLTHRQVAPTEPAKAIVRLTHEALANLVLGTKELDELIDTFELELSGESALIRDLFSMLDTFDLMFDIVCPGLPQNSA